MRLHRTGPCSLQMGDIPIQFLEYFLQFVKCLSTFRKV